MKTVIVAFMLLFKCCYSYTYLEVLLFLQLISCVLDSAMESGETDNVSLRVK